MQKKSYQGTVSAKNTLMGFFLQPQKLKKKKMIKNKRKKKMMMMMKK